MERLGSLLESSESVVETLREKIESGSPFESDVQGFVGGTANILKAVEMINRRKESELKLVMQHQLLLQREELKHKNALELAEKRNAGKVANKVEMSGNVFIGSQQEILKNVKEAMKDMEIIDAEVVEPKNPDPSILEGSGSE